MASTLLSLLLLLLVISATAAPPAQIKGAHDITTVLNQFPNFATMNKLFTQTKVADQMNKHTPVTVFAVADSGMSSVTSLPADVQAKVLSAHVILDYYDMDKISNLPKATAHLTTLFQSSGQATGKTGFINATDVGDGQVQLGSGEDNKLTSEVIRGIAVQPYNISVIEISKVIIPPGIDKAKSGSSNNNSTAPSSAPKAAAPTASSNNTSAPTAGGPASPAGAPDAFAGTPADTPGATAGSPASSGSRLVVGLGIGAAVGVAFLVAL